MDMKSRKKISCKKKAHRTRFRRSRFRRTRTKRGGMMRSARAIAGTLLYHEILPLIRAHQIIHITGHNPQPDEGSITKANERFYQTFKDIPVDNGIKKSIQELREELNNPVKTADKMKLIKDKYDAIMAKLEEERKKKEQARARGLMVVGKAYTPTSRYIASVTDVSSPNINKGSILEQFVNPPFSSPNLKRNTEYSTQKKTPAKPPTKSKLDRHNQSEGDGDDNQNDDMSVSTPSKILFGIETPMSSPQVRSPPPPPPPDQIRNQENRSPQLQLGPLSPYTTAITKKLSFAK